MTFRGGARNTWTASLPEIVETMARKVTIEVDLDELMERLCAMYPDIAAIRDILYQLGFTLQLEHKPLFEPEK